MQDVIVGIIAIAVGALFCARGYLAMRIVIPVWGAFAGFVLGAGIVDAASSDGFLRTAAGWILGLVLAVVFALLAYLYYEISVVIGMGAIGFALGTTVMVALGVSWTWVVILAGVAAATLLAAIALVADLPMVILMVLTATAGASTIVAGLMLLTDTLSTDDFAATSTTERLDDSWGWYLLYVVFVVIGIVLQVRATERLRSSLRDSWAEDGGRQLRPT